VPVLEELDVGFGLPQRPRSLTQMRMPGERRSFGPGRRGEGLTPRASDRSTWPAQLGPQLLRPRHRAPTSREARRNQRTLVLRAFTRTGTNCHESRDPPKANSVERDSNPRPTGDGPVGLAVCGNHRAVCGPTCGQPHRQAPGSVNRVWSPPTETRRSRGLSRCSSRPQPTPASNDKLTGAIGFEPVGGADLRHADYQNSMQSCGVARPESQ
jgi:hypothetical protein